MLYVQCICTVHLFQEVIRVATLWVCEFALVYVGSNSSCMTSICIDCFTYWNLVIAPFWPIVSNICQYFIGIVQPCHHLEYQMIGFSFTAGWFPAHCPSSTPSAQAQWTVLLKDPSPAQREGYVWADTQKRLASPDTAQGTQRTHERNSSWPPSKVSHPQLKYSSCLA